MPYLERLISEQGSQRKKYIEFWREEGRGWERTYKRGKGTAKPRATEGENRTPRREGRAIALEVGEGKAI